MRRLVIKLACGIFFPFALSLGGEESASLSAFNTAKIAELPAPATLADESVSSFFPDANDSYLVELPFLSTVTKEPPFQRALQLVINKNATNAGIKATTFKTALQNPNRYIQQFSNITKNGERYCRIQFNRKAIMQLLQQADATVWVKADPTLLFWIVDGDAGIIENGGDNFSEELRKVARIHHFNVIFPHLDANEVGKIEINDILNEHYTKILQFSERYHVAVVVAGYVKKQLFPFEQWVGNWYLIQNGMKENLVSSAPSREELFVQFFKMITPKVAHVLAPIDRTVKSDLVVTITGVKCFRDVRQITQYLQKLSNLIERVDLITVTAGALQFKLRVMGDPTNTMRALGAASRLTAKIVPGELDVAQAPLIYQWNT